MPASGHQKAGAYSVGWDTRDSHGRQVPYGVYFIQLRTPAVTDEQKVVVTR
jgi:flagellar hook assembly protein FlgD